MSSEPPFIHETAVVDAGAVVGRGTRIWHFCHLMPRSRVGSNCNIGQNVFIDNDVAVGNGVKIQNNVSLYSGVVIEDDAFIGPSAVFTNVINPRSFIERKTEFRPTLVGRGATIGANATLICGIKVGAYALVGAGSVVTKDVAPHALVVGNPARQHGWVSRNGYRLVFNSLDRATCPQTGEEYALENNHIFLLSDFAK